MKRIYTTCLILALCSMASGEWLYPVDNQFNLHYVATAPVIDGAVDSLWHGYEPHACAAIDTGRDDWEQYFDNSADFYSMFRVAWDETALYLLATAFDDIVFPDGDLIEIMIDQDNSDGMTEGMPAWFAGNAAYDEFDVKLSGRVSDTELQVDVRGPGFSFSGNEWPGDNASNEYAAVETADGLGWVIEAKITWQALGVDPGTLAEGTEMGLLVQFDDVDDVDGEGNNVATRTCLWVNGNMVWGDPTSWPTFTLTRLEGHSIIDDMADPGGTVLAFPVTNWTETIYKAPAAPVIDGVEDEMAWKQTAAKGLYPNSTDATGDDRETEPVGDDDFCAWFKMLWDEEALYLLVDVMDELLLPESENLEIMIDPDNSDGMTPDDMTYPAWMGPVVFDIENDAKLSCRLESTTLNPDWIMTESGPSWGGQHPERLTAEVAGKIKADDYGYTWEIKMPWDDLMVDPAELSDGYEIGIYFQIQDYDDLDVFFQAEWGDLKNDAWRNPMGFPTLVLSATPAGTGQPTSVDNRTPSAVPGQFSLSQNYPNPFNPSTTIGYELPSREHVEISVLDLLGRQVRTLVSGQESAGTHYVTWNGVDDSGNAVASGVYLYTLRTGRYSETRKLLLIR